MVTILQVVPRLDAGGSELATIEIAQALFRAGAVRAGRHRRRPHSRGNRQGRRRDRDASRREQITVHDDCQYQAASPSLIRDRKVDLVHARSRAPAWSAFLAAQRTGKPFVTTYHGAYGEIGPFKATYNSVMAKGDRVIANSRYTASVIEERDASARDRIRVIYRGVDRRSSIRTPSMRSPSRG